MTSSTLVLPVSQKIYRKTALDYLKAELLFWDIFQIKETIAKNNGRTVVWRRWTKLAPNTTPLTEGVTPPGSNVSSTSFETDIGQYGDYTIITDVVSETDYSPRVTEEIKAVLNYQMKESIDLIVRDVISASAQVFYPGTKTAGTLAGTDIMNASDYGKQITRLKDANVPKYEGNLYMVIMSAVQEHDLRSDTSMKGYLELSKYTSNTAVQRESVGVFAGGVIKITSQAKAVTVNGVNAREAYFFGKDGFGVTELTAENMEIIVKARGSSGTADPLNQRSSIGWKLWFGASSLDELAAGGKNSRAIKLITATSF